MEAEATPVHEQVAEAERRQVPCGEGGVDSGLAQPDVQRQLTPEVARWVPSLHPRYGVLVDPRDADQTLGWRDPVSAGGPFLHDNLVNLRPVLPRDATPLYRMMLSEPLFYRFRYRGATPSFEDFQRDMSRDVLAQFIVQTRAKPIRQIGLVGAHGANHRSRIAYLSAYAFPGFEGCGLMAAGVQCFVSFVFRCWDIRKIYVEVLEFNLPTFASSFGPVFIEEGRLREFEFFDGQFWDLIVGCLRRDDWTTLVLARQAERSKRRGHLLAMEAIDPDEFLEQFEALLTEIGIFVTNVNLDATLVRDLGLDSLAMLELTELMTSLAPDLTDQYLPSNASVRDLYLLYLQAVQMPTN